MQLANKLPFSPFTRNRMNFEDGSCQWDDMLDSFEISRHALQIHTPMRQNGDIDCANSRGERLYPRLDYSKGFPDWWHLDRTDIKVPSEHTQEGKRYAAEISLAHFYEIGHWKNQVGYVTLFMQDYPNEKPWLYLDKLICQWRRVEEEQRAKCGLPPAPVYKMCELYRGQERTPEDLEFPEEQNDSVFRPVTSQLERPPPVQLKDFGANPDPGVFPLQHCEGRCAVTEDCAVGLKCEEHKGNRPVSGCLGGETMAAGNFCVFDPFGAGYAAPQVVPTEAPTVTMSPTLPQLPIRPAVDFGANPPADVFPLQRCQGDCDTNDDCADGLVCFQRQSNQAIPGCSGGETDSTLSDYCVLDVRGEGYTDPDTLPPTPEPTLKPTAAPTNEPTNKPTLPPVEFAPVPRPTGAQKQIWNRGWEPQFLLGECEGDCDTDEDCLPGLVCFDRDTANVAVPGCTGGESDRSLTDYCIFPFIDLPPIEEPDAVIRNVPLPTVAPTDMPTKEPTNEPTEKPTNKPSVEPTDAPVTDAPVTTTIDETEPVPATSEPTSEPTSKPTVEPTNPPTVEPTKEPTSLPTSEPTTAPTEKPTSKPTVVFTSKPTASPTDQPTAKPTVAANIPLNKISWSPPRGQKLGLCDGDCDVDDDCGEGLKCFQRFGPFKAVPGCVGGDTDSSLMDFCVVDETFVKEEPVIETPIVVQPPVPAPTEVNQTVPDSVTIDAVDVVDVPDIASSTQQGIPPSIDCQMYRELGVNMDRFCDNDHHDMCCQSPRSSSNYCHENYGILGDAVESACHHCCLEENNEAYVVGLENPLKDGLERFTSQQCATEVDNTARICKPKGCCDPAHSDSQFCRQQKFKHGNDWERICWYCCHPSKEHPIDSRRLIQQDPSTMSEEELRMWHKENPRELGSNDVKFTHSHLERELIVREENFIQKGLKDEDAYFAEIHGAFQRRELQLTAKENYEDVHWWPYEFLLKVGTEYYFRYEGSMTVPPCYTVNHWRVMKDPIRVAKHQITELERLLAWRINGQCKADTAGKARKDNPDAVDVNRPLQELEKGHRSVFCECQDWPSKFPAERAWCSKWQSREPELRLFQNPYNWVQDGF